MIPVRCISCGKPISAFFDEYQLRIAEKEDSKVILDEMGIKRYCCRRMLISHVETWE
ncbi:MAG: DNA-directed RNA polymerase subunit N [Methanobacteriaceae archaeon]|jgi:DNA-directed RNA polymerase subunit N|nr:DNA-directed RNA polymerase subunit N [Candidatus Methanorudis spinitermitis]